MSNSIPKPPFVPTPGFDPQSIDRALAFHNCALPQAGADDPFACASQASLFEKNEEVLVRASSILDAAAATAYESADNLCGSNRKVAMGVLHLIELAQQLLDSVLDETSPGPVG